MKMNIKARLKQKWFWLTLIPLLFLLGDNVMQLAATIQATTIGDALYGSATMDLALGVISVLFTILALVGFPVDMTTKGYGDSLQALEYDEPKDDFEEVCKIVLEKVGE